MPFASLINAPDRAPSRREKSGEGNPGGSKSVLVIAWGTMRQRWAIFVLVLFLFPSRASGQLGPKDGADLGPFDLDRVKVGDPAPDFTLEKRQ